MNIKAIKRSLNIYILTNGTVKIDKNIINIYDYLKDYFKHIKIYDIDEINDSFMWHIYTSGHDCEYNYYGNSEINIAFAYNSDCIPKLSINKNEVLDMYDNIDNQYMFYVIFKKMVFDYLNLDKDNLIKELYI